MIINDDNKEMIINFGAFKYDSEKMAIILGVEKNEIEIELKNEKSEFNKLLKKGKYLSEYSIDVKLFSMARAGDLKALEKLQARQNPLNKFNNNGN